MASRADATSGTVVATTIVEGQDRGWKINQVSGWMHVSLLTDIDAGQELGGIARTWHKQHGPCDKGFHSSVDWRIRGGGQHHGWLFGVNLVHAKDPRTQTRVP